MTNFNPGGPVFGPSDFTLQTTGCTGTTVAGGAVIHERPCPMHQAESNATLLAAENARLRQHVENADDVIERLTARNETLQRWLDEARKDRDAIAWHRDQAIARGNVHKYERERAEAERDLMRPVVEAAAELLWLKDGPRDDVYREKKPNAWAALRTGLAAVDTYRAAQKTPTGHPSATHGDEQGEVVPRVGTRASRPAEGR